MMKFIITYNLMGIILKKKAINYMSEFYMMSIYKLFIEVNYVNYLTVLIPFNNCKYWSSLRTIK